MDHGLDAITASLQIIILAQLVYVDILDASVVMIMTSWNFYLKCIEQHVTGTMTFAMINPVDEGLLLVVIMFLVSGFMGN